MTGIQKLAAELADHLAVIKTELSEMPFKADVVLFLRQIASMDGDKPVPVAQVLTVQQHQRVILREPLIWIGPMPHGESLYTGKQLDAARLAAFEAGRRSQQEENQRLLAEVCRLQPLAEQRDAAFARADSAFEDGRRKGLEDAAAVLPGVYYMDPPDGGDVTIIEQLRRMSEDARRYRWLRNEAYGADWEHLGYQERGHTDEAVDFAMGAFEQDKEA